MATDAFGGSFATKLTAFFKTRFPQRKVENLVGWDKPTLEMLERSNELTGIETVIPLQTGLPQGQSVDLRKAINNASPVQGVTWKISPKEYYGGMQLDAKTLMAAQNNEGAFFRLKEREYAGILDSIGLDWERYLWGGDDGAGAGTGVLGRVSQTAADPSGGATFTLDQAADAIAFHQNQRIKFYANSSGIPGAERSAVAAGYLVVGVNYVTGVVTVDQNLNADVAQGDWVVRDGNVNNVFAGIPAWIPASDPTSTLFFGVNRAPHPQMLGGWREPSFLGTIEETVKSLDSRMRRFARKAKVLWLSYSNWSRLEIELGARGTRVEDGAAGRFGRPTLLFTGPGGPISCKAGPFVPEDAGFLLTMDTFKLMTLGAAPHVVRDDGLDWRVIGVASDSSGSLAYDGIEQRLRAFLQLVCLNPFANGRFPIS